MCDILRKNMMPYTQSLHRWTQLHRYVTRLPVHLSIDLSVHH